MIPVIQYHRCDHCNNTHEYVVDQTFIQQCQNNVRVRCGVCGNVRRHVSKIEKEYCDRQPYKPRPI